MDLGSISSPLIVVFVGLQDAPALSASLLPNLQQLLLPILQVSIPHPVLVLFTCRHLCHINKEGPHSSKQEPVP